MMYRVIIQLIQRNIIMTTLGLLLGIGQLSMWMYLVEEKQPGFRSGIR